MQVDLSYSGRNTAREAEQGQAGQTKREREGVESGYSTQNRDEKEKDNKEGNKAGKSEADQIQYIDGEGCQVWRPQVEISFLTMIVFTHKHCLPPSLSHTTQTYNIFTFIGSFLHFK